MLVVFGDPDGSMEFFEYELNSDTNLTNEFSWGDNFQADWFVDKAENVEAVLNALDKNHIEISSDGRTWRKRTCTERIEILLHVAGPDNDQESKGSR